MIHIHLLCVGRMKEPYYEAAVAEYVKRLTPYAKLSIRELPEGHPVIGQIPPSSLTAALCIEGKLCSSEDLAAQMAAWQLDGRSSFCFVIGGSDGLPDDVKKQAHWQLSLSPMTFPHHLARVILLEQLYRACQINAGGKYHK